MAVKVKWYGNDVQRLIMRKASPEMVTKAAFMVEGQTKVNIVQNGQVDTGFMVNSVYTVAPNGDSYAVGAMAGKKAAGPAHPKRDGAVVGVAAEYAIYQEERNAFLFPALEAVVVRGGGQIVAAGRRKL